MSDNLGGKRTGAGRKPLEDRKDIKEPVTIWVSANVIEKVGGLEALKDKLTKFAGGK